MTEKLRLRRSNRIPIVVGPHIAGVGALGLDSDVKIQQAHEVQEIKITSAKVIFLLERMEPQDRNAQGLRDVQTKGIQMCVGRVEKLYKDGRAETEVARRMIRERPPLVLTQAEGNRPSTGKHETQLREAVVFFVFLGSVDRADGISAHDLNEKGGGVLSRVYDASVLQEP